MTSLAIVHMDQLAMQKACALDRANFDPLAYPIRASLRNSPLPNLLD
ncbi:hypothetical protein I603_1563 [Erythrobacter dokdonensis DSW-74]|uniref:Uncharacterized protein n=1 Tax=Erythrobacter dokdonensis DSW-74 TaxID=1300349 RepID=A0A1A7BIX4_9SPHN|nr:hypothetical protein I603_1563 [Erythrobacter dokdonensis DSW-74]